jgi:signal transduction histidine kinase
VRQVTQVRSYLTGDVVFKEGDDGDGIYLVRAGQIQISTGVGQSDHRTFTQIHEGEMFGEMSVMDNNKRSATASAVLPSELYFIARGDVMRLLEQVSQLSVNLVRDISLRLREFNKQYIRDLIQSERLVLVGRFARSIVHDIKNPLNIIGIAADMAGAPTATPELRQSTKLRIRKQVDRISNMINELLEFTRGGQSQVVLSMTDYSAFVLHLVDELRPEMSLKNATIVLENDPPPVKVAMNPQRLPRVFYNLMHNATDAMPNGGEIKVRFECKNQEVVTEIEDGGSGIAPQVIDRIFEAFVTYGKAQGTGLGLSICKRIIDDHQGRISARNRPDGGAIFAFTLPIREG